MLAGAALTFALLVVFAGTVWLSRVEMARGSPPFILYVGAYYFVFFGLLSWFAAAYVPHLPYDDRASAKAALFIVAFVALQLAAYALTLHLVRPRAMVENETLAGPLALVAWGGIALTLLFYALPVLHTLPSVPQLKQPSWYFAVSVLAYLSFQRRISRQHSVAFAVAVLAKFVLDLRNGEVTHMVFSGIIILNAALLFRRRAFAVACVAVTVVAISSYGYVKHYARSVVRADPTNIFRLQADVTPSSLLASFTAMARRSSPALLTSHVIARTPDPIPFDPRNPLIDALANHIPRAFWRDKPLENLGGVFGRRYGILSTDDYRTSWNICWAADFYITGGFAWALTGTLFVGALLGLAIGLLSRLPDRAFSFGLFSATIFPLFYQESNFSLMAGSVFWSAGFLFISYWTARRLFALRPTGTR